MTHSQPITNSLSFGKLWNISFAFFGIQFGWALQIANTSAIYEYLGASTEQLPLLWLAAPVSGLIVQPIIGYLSDRTWCFLGRRRPYFLVGAIISSIDLVLMPNASSLWMAVALLWILAISINASLSPFFAFVADSLPKTQKNQGFALQSFFIGFASAIASITPWYFSHKLGISNLVTDSISIPHSVKLSFYLGAVIFVLAVIWTVLTTEESPPENIDQNQHSLNILALLKEMPTVMKQLAWVQFFTWLGMFCVILYFPLLVAYRIFGATDRTSLLYTEGIEWAGICIAVYNCVCFLFSLFLPQITDAIGRKITHSFCLICGGFALISLLLIQDKYSMLLPMACLGIAQASIMSIPYAILSNSIPAQNMGVYMGIFNAFIVIPQIFVALGLGWLMFNYFDNNPLLTIVLGGFSLLVAAILAHRIEE